MKEYRKSKAGLNFIIVTAIIAFSIACLEFKVLPAAAGLPDSRPPLLERVEATSKQIVYLLFDKPIILTGDPASWTITQNVYGAPPAVAMAQVTDDKRAVKVILTGEQGTGNQPVPLKYTITVRGIQDEYGNLMPEDNTANCKTWEAFSPHGKFAVWSGGAIPAGSSIALCGQCHTAHNNIGRNLLSSATVKQVCFVCHSILGPSVYRVEAEFVARSVYNTDFSTSLHKSLDSGSPGYDVLTCVDCHNPHGDLIDRNVSNAVYPKLLKVSDGAGNLFYNGNGVCLACHGQTDRGFEKGAYYPDTGGSHDNTGAVHYDNVNFAVYLNPASGTQITCLKCHEKHGSRYTALLDNSAPNEEEQLCFKSGCHGTANPAKNIYDGFYGGDKVSRHDVTGADGRGKIECTNCHGPHTVQNSPNLRISDPDNTKNLMGASGDFCLKCHDGSAPVKTLGPDKIVPFTVTFNVRITSNGPGWNKTETGNHADISAKNCTGCHTWHGSRWTGLIREDDGWNIDGTYGYSFTGNSGCLNQCHNGEIARANVAFPYGQAYTHPTFTNEDVKHSNTENWDSKTVGRHAECSDCHDVHTAVHPERSGTLYEELGINGQVSGVVIESWNQATWSTWDSVTPDWRLDGLVPGVSSQYQLCLKCHSKYSYNLNTLSDSTGSAPQFTPSSAGDWAGSFRQTDVAKDFNPANPAYHSVIGESKIPTFVYGDQTYYYGKFISPWTARSKLKCTDCHDSPENTASKGPHGSAYRYILKAKWVTNPDAEDATGKAGTSDHLCFRCHDYGFYTGTDTGSATVRSQFNLPNETGYNYHANSHNNGKPCAKCHGGLPHGWKYTDSNGGGVTLVRPSDPLPYSQGVSSLVYWRGVNGTPENWTCKSCHLD